MTGKIYKLQHDDGHFYIGSTTKSLNERLSIHKCHSKDMKSKLYRYINNEWDKVKIELIEEVEHDHRQKEDEYIRKELDNPLCLNSNRAHVSSEEQRAENIERSKLYNEQNRERVRTNYHYDKSYKKSYYQQNKERIKAYQNAYYHKKINGDSFDAIV